MDILSAGACLFVGNEYFFLELDIFTLCTLLLEAVCSNGCYVLAGAAVEDRNFDTVEFDDRIVHAEAGECRQDVLYGVNLAAILAESSAAGRIRNHIGAGRNGHALGDISETDAGILGGRRNNNTGISACVKAFSRKSI